MQWAAEESGPVTSQQSQAVFTPLKQTEVTIRGKLEEQQTWDQSQRGSHVKHAFYHEAKQVYLYIILAVIPEDTNSALSLPVKLVEMLQNIADVLLNLYFIILSLYNTLFMSKWNFFVYVIANYIYKTILILAGITLLWRFLFIFFYFSHSDLVSCLCDFFFVFSSLAPLAVKLLLIFFYFFLFILSLWEWIFILMNVQRRKQEVLSSTNLSTTKLTFLAKHNKNMAELIAWPRVQDKRRVEKWRCDMAAVSVDPGAREDGSKCTPVNSGGCSMNQANHIGRGKIPPKSQHVIHKGHQRFHTW